MDRTRRWLMIGATVAPLLARWSRIGHAASHPKISVMKDPNCDCCSGWTEHLRKEGFEVESIDSPDLSRIKARLGVPTDLVGCHTAQVEGYVIEGHVPASAIRRLLQERPAAIGLAVPGMPINSPGMEVPGAPDEPYEVILFGPQRRTFARFKGAAEN
jgi:hypothetical protein